MSHETRLELPGVTFVHDTKDGLSVEMDVGDLEGWGVSLSRQDALRVIEFLQSNLEEPEHARSTLRPFLDRPTT